MDIPKVRKQLMISGLAALSLPVLAILTWTAGDGLNASTYLVFILVLTGPISLVGLVVSGLHMRRVIAGRAELPQGARVPLLTLAATPIVGWGLFVIVAGLRLALR